MSEASSGGHVTRYAPGSHRLIVVGDCAVLLPGTVLDDDLGEIWSAAAAREPLVALARAVLDHLAELPSLAVAVVDGAGRASLLLRGSARAAIAAEVVDAGGAALWRDVVVGADSLVLALDDAEWSPSLPLDGGIVAAGAVTWIPRAAVSGSLEAGPPFAEAWDERALASTGIAVEPVVTRLENTLVSAEYLPTSERTAVLAEDAAGRGRAESEPAISPADPDLPEPEDPVDSYDRLFAATSLYAPARPDPDSPVVAAGGGSWAPAPTPSVPAAPALLPGPDAVADLEPAPEPAPAPLAPGRNLIDSVPGGGSRPVRTAQATEEVAAAAPAHAAKAANGSEDDEGLTIARSALPKRTSGVSVQGVLCVAGHPNPAEAATCRVCRADVPEQSSSTMPRPSLGALVGVDLPAGAPRRIPLRGPMILGRRPQADGLTGGIPELVVVDSPDKDLSRNHVRVTLDGWHVLVTDLGSTNGTVVEEPGRSPERIHPDRPTMITPGTRIVLGEVATYVYEVES